MLKSTQKQLIQVKNVIKISKQSRHTFTPKGIFNIMFTKDFLWINSALILCFDIGIFDI